MHKHQTVWILLCCFLPGVLCDCKETCPPAEEGKQFTLYCKGPFTKNVGQILWTSTNRKDNIKWTQTVSHCNETTCIYDENRYSVSLATHNDTFTSKLTIHTVNYSERGLVFSCVLNTPVKIYKLTCCSMKTYVSPRNFRPPICQVRLAWGNQIELSCQILQTYPGITTFIYQRLDLGPYNLLQDKLDCQERHETGNYTDYETNCSALISVWSPGSYQFIVIVAPGLGGFSVNSYQISFKFTRDIEITAIPSVKIQHLPEMKLCRHSTKPVIFICNYAWLPSASKFRWYVDNIFVGQGNIISTNQTEYANGTFYFYKSSYVYKPRFLYHGLGQESTKRVKCEATYTFDRNEISLSDESDLKHVWPPVNPPVFTDHRGKRLGQIYVVKELNMTVSCVVDGGEPQVSSVRIECWDSDRTERLAFDNRRIPGIVLHLNLTDIQYYPVISCRCSANHTTKCYNLNTSITFYTKSSNSHLRQTNASVHDATSVVYYIIAGIATGFILAIIIPVFIVILWRRSKFYQHEKTLVNRNQLARNRVTTWQYHRSLGSLDSLPLQPNQDIEDQDNGTSHLDGFTHLERPPAAHRQTKSRGNSIFEKHVPLEIHNPLATESYYGHFDPDPPKSRSCRVLISKPTEQSLTTGISSEHPSRVFDPEPPRPTPCGPVNSTTHVQVPYKYQPKERQEDNEVYGTII